MQFSPDEKKNLVRKFSNKSRKAALVANRVIAPRIFSDDGAPLPEKESFDKHFSFNLREAAFLVALRDAKGDLDKAIADRSEDPDWAKRLLKRNNSQAFLQEDEHYAALAEVGTLSWVKGKIMATVLGEENPTETQKWGLERLEKINSPKVSLNQFNTQNNFYQMPKMTAEEQAFIKAWADRRADVQEGEIANP